MVTPERWQQIKTVLADALDQPAIDRGAFLDRVCGDDVSLRAEVESLMAYEKSGESVLDSPAGSALSAAPPSLTNPTQPEEANQETEEPDGKLEQRIGPYKIVSELGRGGMGAVYMAARADDQYRRQVAIKLIRRGMDSDFVLRRFRNERQILAGLDHPNIAKLLDGGSTEDGLPYLVMEYVAGVPIDDYCDRNALDTEQRLRLFQQACSAIQYAHERQVIHRDIKPSNILVGEESGLKLLDFGIAKLLTPDLAAQTLDSTAPALRLMTPAYASPEQIKGEMVTTTTDVYSLGVLLYELLTGHKPYRAKSQAPHNITQAVLEEEPLKPSTAINLTEETTNADGSSAITLTPELVSKTREGTPDRLRRRLRGDLDNIVLSALRKDPQHRYASVEQFSEDIRRHLEGRAVIARKSTLTYRASKFIRRNRVAVAAVILSTVLLGLVVLLTSSTSNQLVIGANAQSVAVLPFRTIGTGLDEEYLGTGIPDAIVSALTNVAGVRVRPLRASLKYSGANQDPVEAGRALQVDAILEGTVSRAGAKLRVTARLLRVEDGALLWKASDEFDSLLRAQDLIPIQIADALNLKMSEQERALVARRYTDSPEAYELYLKGRYFLNRRNSMNAKQALDSFEKAIEVDPSYALAIAGLAHIHTLLVNPLPALERMQRAKAEATRALEIDGTLAEAHMALGRALIYCDWDWAASEKAFTRAIELCPNYPDAHFWYSHSLTALGRHDEALAELKRALESDPSSSRYALRVGWALYLAREYDRAIEEFRKTPFEVDSNYYTVYRGLGLAYVEKSMYKEAISMFEKAEVLSGEIPLVKASLAYTHAKSGNGAEARRVLDELAALPGGEVPSMVLVGTYGYLGERDKAVNLLQTIYEKRLPTLIGVKVEPMLDSVRSDPRFEEIVRRIGLAP